LGTWVKKPFGYDQLASSRTEMMPYYTSLWTWRSSQLRSGESVLIDLGVHSHSEQYSKLRLLQGRGDMALKDLIERWVLKRSHSFWPGSGQLVLRLRAVTDDVKSR
jgi:hypothetical protein